MTHSPAAQQYREKQAGDLQIGDHVFPPGDGQAEEVSRIETIHDDFGVPALLMVTTADGGLLRIAVGSSVPVGSAPATDALPPLVPFPGSAPADPADGSPAGSAEGSAEGSSDAETPDGGSPDGGSPAEAGGEAEAVAAVVVPPLPAGLPAFLAPSAAELALIPEPAGTPESVVAAAAAEHLGNNGVQVLSERLVKGINTKSGSCLRDLSDLAHDLCIILRDPDHALAIADLLNVLPFDGNNDRWTSIERALALSSFICREAGLDERAAVYEKLLRAPESQETDPFKARINAKVSQRKLNEPNLYDKEIFRSIDNSNHDAEREWRYLRLESLLFLRAHGGSETIGVEELQRRIANELEAVRA
ncbi:DUF6707 family protein [Arthrobacter sp. CJ23]|uniref:DUF6707 family protein n=1 Tax=Arthrobacter sp. CJ23 TaxID=2972479 RepID=UPI00215D3333|nr:DUF6707 family protein [Arthrobacter sp. CJ23]UVJ40182.1 hypothetical protein NVV90_03050 [Arthrobacter sp. CJ23]